jgi:hypothetical protein
MLLMSMDSGVDEYQDVLDKDLNSLADFDKHIKSQGLLPKPLSRLHDVAGTSLS